VAPVLFARGTIQEAPGDVVMAVAKDGCSDGDGVAENSLCGIAAAIDLRGYFFDDYAFAAFKRFHLSPESS
jgi:hypothetical protein